MKPQLANTLPTYTWPGFRDDLFAGFTVAMVAIPLSLAIAIASGANPAQGLTTAVIGGFLISLLGGSRVQIGGPTGAFIVVVAGVIATHGYDGLVVATLMAGAILVGCALLRLGELVRFVPEPVINGFTIGIAIIIATSQLKDLLGMRVDALPADFLEKLPVLWSARGSVSLPALGVGLATMALIILFRRAAPRLPGLIVAIAATSGLAALSGMPIEKIAGRFGELPHGLPAPAWPDLSPQRFGEMLPSALVIAFLAGIESLLSAMVADRMTSGAHRPNAELLAQGAANIGSALFGGLPATGAIARTATNIRAGGKTPVAGLIHALVILLALMFAAPLAGQLAMPALAGLLIITAWNMSEPHKWGSYLKAGREDQILLALTLVLTVIADLTIAISVGVALGLAFRLRARKSPPQDWTPPTR